jgi:hypothetical protein
VESITYRVTVLRDHAGVVHVFPNGFTNTLANTTPRWAAYAMDIGVAYETEAVGEGLSDVCFSRLRPGGWTRAARRSWLRTASGCACRPTSPTWQAGVPGGMPQVSAAEIKVVGKSGQISLGKSYAGKTLRLERHEDGRIVLTAVAMVPESQLWTTEEPDRSRIARGLAWAAETRPEETRIDSLLRRRRKTSGRSRGRGA